MSVLASSEAGFAAARRVRYADLAPCRNAFVDSRTPGSDAKENFTIIGPGVSENPNQHVHIPEPHGFNIGGARQPPGCLNSQHSHLTAEVFVVHSGSWRFNYGVNADDGSVDLGPGDTISIPPMMFRGFENIGDDTGFLFAVLGGDDPGRVTWAPDVFDLASHYGLVLLEGGKLVDTTIGERVPESAVRVEPPTEAEIAELATPSADKLARCVSRAHGARPDEATTLGGNGCVDSPVIIDDRLDESAADDGAIHGWWQHGFDLRRLSLQADGAVPVYSSATPEVLFVHEGQLSVELDGHSIEAGTGDTISLPAGVDRAWRNQGDTPAVAYLVKGR